MHLQLYINKDMIQLGYSKQFKKYVIFSGLNLFLKFLFKQYKFLLSVL